MASIIIKSGYYKRNHGKTVYAVSNETEYKEYRKLSSAAGAFMVMINGDSFQISSHGLGVRSVQIFQSGMLIADRDIR